MKQFTDIGILRTYRDALTRWPYHSEALDQLPEEYRAMLDNGLQPKMVAPELLKTIFLKMLNDVTPGFVVDENNSEVIERNIEHLRSDSKKGLMLMGSVGCGKTALMKGLAQFMALFTDTVNRRPYNVEMKPSYQITSSYNQKGDIIFGAEQEGGNYWYDGRLVASLIIIDDLGSESMGNYFGKSCNVIEELLLRRYDAKSITHCTTNLDAAALKKLYGPRVASRLKEMFTTLHLKGVDRRK